MEGTEASFLLFPNKKIYIQIIPINIYIICNNAVKYRFLLIDSYLLQRKYIIIVLCIYDLISQSQDKHMYYDTIPDTNIRFYAINMLIIR